MKQTLFLLLFSSFLQAQTTTTDFQLGTDGVTYYQLITVTQDDGSYVTTANIVGPASALAADQADKIEAKARELANAAFVVSKANLRLNEITTVDANITTLTTVSPLKTITARYASRLMASGWNIDKGSGLGFESLVFTIDGSNNLRYSIAGAATKPATIFGDVITLGGYPVTGTNLDFYMSENGENYFSLPNRSVIIEKP